MATPTLKPFLGLGREWAAGRLAADSQKAALRLGVSRGAVCLNVLKGSGPGLAYPWPITPTVVPEAGEGSRLIS